MLDKEKLINSMNEKIEFLEVENIKDSLCKAKELKELLYVINKGCFDIN